MAEDAKKILIIDDEEVVCESLSEILISQGYLLKTSFTAQDGLRWIDRTGFDLVILDKNIPDMNWKSVVKKINESGRNTGIILITGYPSLDSVTEAIDMGVSQYLVKPFKNLNQVLSVVKRTLEHRQIRRGFQERIKALQQSTDRLRKITGVLEEKTRENEKE